MRHTQVSHEMSLGVDFFSRRCLGKSRTVRPSVSEASVKRDTTAMYHLIATKKLNMQSRAAQQGGKGSQGRGSPGNTLDQRQKAESRLGYTLGRRREGVERRNA